MPSEIFTKSEQDSPFSFEGKVDNISAYIGKSGLSYCHVVTRARKTAAVFLCTNGADERGRPGIRHAAEHVMCTLDLASYKQTVNEKIDDYYVGKGIPNKSDATFQNLLDFVGCDASERFDPVVTSNATTRDSNTSFYSYGLSNIDICHKQLTNLAHQLFSSKLLPNETMSENTVLREAKAVLHEAERGRTSISQLLKASQDVADIDARRETRASVIGENNPDKPDADNMQCMKQGGRLLRSIRALAAKDNFSRISFVVISDGERTYTDERFVDFARRCEAAALNVMELTGVETESEVYSVFDDAHYLTPSDACRTSHSSAQLLLSVKEDGYLMGLLEMTGTPNAYKESVNYWILAEILRLDSIQTTMKTNSHHTRVDDRCASFQVMWDGVGMAPAFQIIFGPSNSEGYDAAKRKLTEQFNMLHGGEAEKLFNEAKCVLTNRWEGWESNSSLNDDIPNLMSTHPTGAKSIFHLYLRQQIARELTFAKWQTHYIKEVFPRLLESREVKMISESMLQSMSPRELDIIKYEVRGESISEEMFGKLEFDDDVGVSSAELFTSKFLSGIGHSTCDKVLAKLRLVDGKLNIKTIREIIRSCTIRIAEYVFENGDYIESVPGTECFIVLRIDTNDKLVSLLIESCVGTLKKENILAFDVIDIGYSTMIRVKVAPEHIRAGTVAITDLFRQLPKMNNDVIAIAIASFKRDSDDIRKALCDEAHLKYMGDNTTYSELYMATPSTRNEKIRTKMQELLQNKIKITYFLPDVLCGKVECTTMIAEVRVNYTLFNDFTMSAECSSLVKGFERKKSLDPRIEISSTQWMARGVVGAFYPIVALIPITPQSIDEFLVYQSICDYLGHGGWNSQLMCKMRREYGDVYGITSDIIFPRFENDPFCMRITTEFEKGKYRKGCEDLDKTILNFMENLSVSVDSSGKGLGYWIKRSKGMFDKLGDIAKATIRDSLRCRDLGITVDDYSKKLAKLATFAAKDGSDVMKTISKVVDAFKATRVLTAVNFGSGGNPTCLTEK